MMCEAEFAAMLDVLDVIITDTNRLADEVAKIHDSVKVGLDSIIFSNRHQQPAASAQYRYY